MAATIAALATAAIIATVLMTASDGESHRGPLDAYDGTSIEPLLRCFGGFALGMLAFRLARSERFPWLRHDATIAAILLLLIAGLAGNAHDLAIVACFPLLVVGLYRNRGRLGDALGCRVLHWLGVISYSVYLVHPFLVAPKTALESEAARYLPASAADLLASSAIYALLLLLSSLTYRAIEEPGRRGVNRLARYWSRRADRPIEGGVPAIAQS